MRAAQARLKIENKINYLIYALVEKKTFSQLKIVKNR